MIPHIIHYCWFGHKPLPQSAHRCIESWRRYFPEWEIREWNESNFDVNLMPFTREAYAARKYAFVSDVARFWILQHEGGLYFDTDVEVVQPFDDILSASDAFMGIEKPAHEGETLPTVNAGLGMGFVQGHPFLQEVISHYQSLHYQDSSSITVVTHITQLLASHGLLPTNAPQTVAGIRIYPQDYFCPMNNNTGQICKTSHTHSIHWFEMSWIGRPKIYFRITRLLHRLFGESCLSWAK